MNIKSFSLISTEIKQIKILHETVSRSFVYVGKKSENNEKLTKSERKLFSEARLRKNNETLRELMFVRLVSALESFLVDAIKDVFVLTKTPFMDGSEVVFHKNELLANGGAARIYQKIIDKETRAISSGGFIDFAKYYKKKFDIDFSQIRPGIAEMVMYHDIRNLIVHRLGFTDNFYRRKYKTDQKKISMHQELFDNFLSDVEFFSKEVSGRVARYIENVAVDEQTKRSKMIVDLHFLNNEQPVFLDKNYEYWADDEYVLVSDVLQRTEVTSEGRVRFYFDGSDRAMRYMHRFLKREQRKFRLSMQEVSINFAFEKGIKFVPEDVVQKIKSKLPVQPWVKGVHKQVAQDLGISAKIVSSAITILISRGDFKNQIFGQMIE